MLSAKSKISYYLCIFGTPKLFENMSSGYDIEDNSDMVSVYIVSGLLLLHIDSKSYLILYGILKVSNGISCLSNMERETHFYDVEYIG